MITLWFVPRLYGELEFFELIHFNIITNLVKRVHIFKTSSDHVEQTWLACYLILMCIIHDNQGEFVRFDFIYQLEVLDIKAVGTTVKTHNPQSNAILNHMHQLFQLCRYFSTSSTVCAHCRVEWFVDETLATTRHALFCTV